LYQNIISEEDVTAVKAAVYFLEVAVNHRTIKKQFVINVMKLVLMTLSRISPSQESYDKLQDDATTTLTIIIKQASDKICKQRFFKFDNEEHRSREIMVNTCLVNLNCKYFSIIVLE